MVSMVKSRTKKVMGVLLILLLIGIGIGGKRYMDKQKTEKEYQQGIELIQSYVTDYLVKNYQGIEKIEWQGIGVEYRNSPILGPSLFGNYVSSRVKIFVSKGNNLTMIYRLNDETEYNDDAKKYVRLESLNSKWIDDLLQTELENTVGGGKKGDKMTQLEAERLKKSDTGSSNAKLIYNLKIHELIY